MNAGDMSFARVVMLLHMEGTDSGTVFSDSSIYTRGITANGAITSTAVVRAGSAAAYFSSEAYLAINQSADFSFGTGDFTVEVWVFITSYGGNPFRVLRYNNGTSNDFTFEISSAGALVFFGASGGTSTTWANGAVPLNSWTHVAFCRAGGVMTAYVNGTPQAVASGSSTNTTNITSSSGVISIGAGTAAPFSTALGYADELRVTHGVARYAGSFSPSTSFADYSVQWDNYYTSVVLSLHGDGSNGSTTFTDSSRHARTPTGSSGSSITTAHGKFAQAIHFDGSGDGRIYYADSADFDMASGNFTIDGWAKTATPGDTSRMFLFGKANGSGGDNPCTVYAEGAVLKAGINVGGTGHTLTGPAIPTDWFHFALVRNGTTVTLFLDGAVAATVTVSGAILSNTNLFAVGGVGSYVGGGAGGSIGDRWLGYVDELRITKGAARYTGPFTPMPAPNPDRYFAWANMSAALSFNGVSGSTTFVDDSPRPKAFTASGGTAVLSTAQAFAGSASLVVTGSSYVSCPDHADFQFGSDDFTIECRILVDSVPTSGNYQGICGRRTNSSSMSYILYLNGDIGGVPRFDYNLSAGGGGSVVGPAVIAGQWNHIAVSRAYGTLRLFTNGVAGTPVNIGTSAIDTGSFPFHIGQLSLGVPSYPLAGHIDNLRVYKGGGLYTSDFTTPLEM